jgi:hypothetical protein
MTPHNSLGTNTATYEKYTSTQHTNWRHTASASTKYSPADVVGVAADEVAQAVRQEYRAHVGLQELLDRAVVQHAHLQCS